MNAPDFQSIDGETLSRFFWDGTTLTREASSLDEARIMAENRELAGQARTMEWGRVALRMSWSQYLFFLRLFPELREGDARARRWRWQRIANDVDFRALQVGKF